MKKKIIVASVFTVALIGGIIGIKSVSGGHHTSGDEDCTENNNSGNNYGSAT
mgnify:CR=1 FL=1